MENNQEGNAPVNEAGGNVENKEDVKQPDNTEGQGEQTVVIKAELEKAQKELEEKYKSEIAGLNRKTNELQKALKEKELEGKSEAEQAEALRLEKEQIQKEIAELNRGRLIDKQLDSAGLPLDFAKRITGADESSIETDVKEFGEYIEKIALQKAEKIINERLGGAPPESGSNPNGGILTLDEIEKLPQADRMAALERAGYR
jgi:hypothetical protein